MFKARKVSVMLRLGNVMISRQLNSHIPRVPVQTAEPISVEVSEETIQLLEKISLVNS